MAGTKEIKRRIKSIKNTKKITKAMELVAASKMKRAVSSTLASRLYAGYSWEVLTSIAKSLDEITHPFFIERAEGRILLVIITSNRGLCGAYNAQVIKKSLSFLKNQKQEIIDTVSIGKRGDTAMRRVGKAPFATFTELPNNISLLDVLPISKLIVNEYKSGSYGQVVVVYTDYISALTQKPNIKQLLPISKQEMKEVLQNAAEVKKMQNETQATYLFEGDKEKLIGDLAEKLTRMQIYQMLLESNASEQSSRMLAMKNATEASGEMIDDLTLVFNKARQANITREISEISAGMASVN